LLVIFRKHCKVFGLLKISTKVNKYLINYTEVCTRKKQKSY